jgi:hypothetical protein
VFLADLRSIVQESWSKALLAASAWEKRAQVLLGNLTRRVPPEVREALRKNLARLPVPARVELRAIAHRIELLEQRLARVQTDGETRLG